MVHTFGEIFEFCFCEKRKYSIVKYKLELEEWGGGGVTVPTPTRGRYAFSDLKFGDLVLTFGEIFGLFSCQKN